MKPELLNAGVNFFDDFMEAQHEEYALHLADAKRQIEELDLDAPTAAFAIAHVREMLANDLLRVRREVKVIAGTRTDEGLH